MTDEKLIERLRKILAMAEGAGTKEEAEAFTAKATELMIKHSIDEAMLSKGGTKTSEAIIMRDFLIEGYAKAKMQLLHNIAAAMGCKSVYTPNTRQSGWKSISVSVIGWESDIASIEVLFASLVMQVTNEMEREAKANPHVHGRAFKQAFILGFAGEVSRRLVAQRQSAVEVADDATPGAALAVVERSTAVENDFRRRFPKTGKGSGASASDYTGYGAGKAAGQRANLGQTQVGGGRRAIGR